jgi:hypothetical protein
LHEKYRQLADGEDRTAAVPKIENLVKRLTANHFIGDEQTAFG